MAGGGASRSNEDRGLRWRFVPTFWPRQGQLSNQARQEVQRIPSPLLHVGPGKHSAVPHADQTDTRIGHPFVSLNSL